MYQVTIKNTGSNAVVIINANAEQTPVADIKCYIILNKSILPKKGGSREGQYMTQSQGVCLCLASSPNFPERTEHIKFDFNKDLMHKTKLVRCIVKPTSRSHVHSAKQKGFFSVKCRYGETRSKLIHNI